MSNRIGVLVITLGPLISQAAELPWQDRDRPANWQCASCPLDTGLDVSTVTGAAYQSDDSFKFGDYTGLDEDGAFIIADFSAAYRGESAWGWSAGGTDLGLDSRQLRVEGGQQGRFDLRLAYDELPRRRFESSRTIYAKPGAANQELPAGWVRAPNTAGMTALDDSLRPGEAKWDRDTLSTGLSFIQSPRLRYDFSYRHMERDGAQLRSLSFLNSATSLLRPVDDATDTLDAELSYAADTWSARLAYLGSFYNNDVKRFDWENAFTAAAPGADAGRSALEPDNEFQQLTLSGHYHGWQATRLSGRLAAGQMKQNDKLFPYTVNPLLAGGVLPRTRSDGEVDTLYADLRFSSRLTRRLRLRGDIIYDERDNETPRDSWNYVVSDTITAPLARDNLPYGYERVRLNVSGSYRFPYGTSAQLGYRYDRRERDFTEVDHTAENEIWAELAVSPVNRASLRAKYSYATRDASDYDPVPATQPAQNPLLRKFNLADRDRESLELNLSLQPSDRLDIGFSSLLAADEYPDTDLGLERGEHRNLSMDLSLNLSQELRIGGQLGYDDYRTRQLGSQSFSAADWSAEQQDESWIAGLSITLPRILDRLQARINYSYIDTTGKIRNDTSGLRTDFPDLSTKRHRVEVDLRYDLGKQFDIGFNYVFEDYSVDDWTLDGVNPDTVGNFLASGARWPGYDVNVFRLSFRWSLAN